LANLETVPYLAQDVFRVLFPKQNEGVGFTYQRFTLTSAGSVIDWRMNRRLTFHSDWISASRKSLLPGKYLPQSSHWAIYPEGAPVFVLGGALTARHLQQTL